jgi:glycosyltransferase involved in cell wall biosynthesis
LVEHEKNGLLVAPGDVAGLAAALERLASDALLRQRLGRAARATIEERFDGRRIVQRYDELFAAVLGRPSTLPEGLRRAERARVPGPRNDG